MKQCAVLAIILAVLGCERSGLGPVETKQGALASGGFAPWTQIPGETNLWSKPAIVSTYTGPANRQWYVCGTTVSNTVECSYRVVLGMTSSAGMDSGWTGWQVIAPPAGDVFGPSAPALAMWVDPPSGHTLLALAARVYDSSCYNCVYVQLTADPFTQNPSTGPWFQVSQSGNFDPYANLGDISLVASGGYLYLFGVGGALDPTYGAYFDGPPYQGFYATMYVGGGFVNSSWSWASIPGNGLFNTAISATPLTGGGAIVVGVGTDNQAYGEELYQGTWDGSWWFAGSSQTFSDAVADTSFDPEGADVETFGLGPDYAELQGNLYDWSQFDGWYSFSVTTGFSRTTDALGRSPVAYSPAGTNHIDLVAVGLDRTYYITEFNGSAIPGY